MNGLVYTAMGIVVCAAAIVRTVLNTYPTNAGMKTVRHLSLAGAAIVAASLSHWIIH